MNNGPGMEGGDKENGTPAAVEAAFEGRLRESLRPVALPPGFAERVLAAARAQDAAKSGAGLPEPPAFPMPAQTAAKVLPFRRRAAVVRLVAGGALAASVLAGTFGVEMERRHRETQREAAVASQQRAAANQQFEQATRITDEALAHTREQLEQAGVFDDQGR